LHLFARVIDCGYFVTNYQKIILKKGESGKLNSGSTGKIVKRKPDLMLVLLAVFGLGVVITLSLPMSSSRSVAEPVSALQAGVIAHPELTSQ
jgi:hypothetical protein